MTRKDIILGAIAVCALIGAVVMAVMNSGGNEYREGLDRLSYWTCLNDECGAAFEMTLAEFEEVSAKNDGYTPCPDCGKITTRRANICPHCSEIVKLLEHERMPDRCPHCEKLIGMGRGGDAAHRHADGEVHSHDYVEPDHDHDGP